MRMADLFADSRRHGLRCRIYECEQFAAGVGTGLYANASPADGQRGRVQWIVVWKDGRQSLGGREKTGAAALSAMLAALAGALGVPRRRLGEHLRRLREEYMRPRGPDTPDGRLFVGDRRTDGRRWWAVRTEDIEITIMEYLDDDWTGGGTAFNWSVEVRRARTVWHAAEDSASLEQAIDESLGEVADMLRFTRDQLRETIQDSYAMQAIARIGNG